jgi:hypothetical protein
MEIELTLTYKYLTEKESAETFGLYWRRQYTQ